MKLAIYNENCNQAGRQVSDPVLERYDDWEDGGDWTVHNGTPEELLEEAATIERNARPGGGGQFDRRVARTLREAVYFERPELEPVEEDED